MKQAKKQNYSINRKKLQKKNAEENNQREN